MKAIFITGEDFAATHFEEQFQGKTVKSIIDSGVTEVTGEDYYFEIISIEVGEVSEKFLNFVRDKMIDYDQGKSENFWLENEII